MNTTRSRFTKFKDGAMIATNDFSTLYMFRYILDSLTDSVDDDWVFNISYITIQTTGTQ